MSFPLVDTDYYSGDWRRRKHEGDVVHRAEREDGSRILWILAGIAVAGHRDGINPEISPGGGESDCLGISIRQAVPRRGGGERSTLKLHRDAKEVVRREFAQVGVVVEPLPVGADNDLGDGRRKLEERREVIPFDQACGIRPGAANEVRAGGEVRFRNPSASWKANGFSGLMPPCTLVILSSKENWKASSFPRMVPSGR